MDKNLYEIVLNYQENNDPSDLEPHLIKIYTRLFEYFDGVEKHPFDLSPFKSEIINHGFKIAGRWNGKGNIINVLTTSMMCAGRQYVRADWNKAKLKELYEKKKNENI